MVCCRGCFFLFFFFLPLITVQHFRSGWKSPKHHLLIHVVPNQREPVREHARHLWPFVQLSSLPRKMCPERLGTRWGPDVKPWKPWRQKKKKNLSCWITVCTIIPLTQPPPSFLGFAVSKCLSFAPGWALCFYYSRTLDIKTSYALRSKQKCPSNFM